MVRPCSYRFPKPFLSSCSLWLLRVGFRCTCCSFTWVRWGSLLGPWKIRIRSLWICRFFCLGQLGPSGTSCICFWRLSSGFSQLLSCLDCRQKYGNRFMAIPQGFYLSIQLQLLFSKSRFPTFCDSSLSWSFWSLGLQFMGLIRFMILVIRLSYWFEFRAFGEVPVAILVFRLIKVDFSLATTFWWLELW